MTEESKKDDKPEGPGKKPKESGQDKPGDKPGAAADTSPEQKPGDAGGVRPKGDAAPAAAKEPEKKTAASVPPSGAGPKPAPSTPPSGAGPKPGPSTPPSAAAAKPAEGKRPPAAPPKKAKRGGCLTSFLWLVAVLVAIVVAGYFTWPQWSQYVADYLPKAAPTEDPRVADLESRVAELESKLSAPRPEADAIRALQADRKSINQRLDRALKEVNSMQKAIASLGKMAELAEGVGDDDAQRSLAALTLEINGLRQDLGRSVESTQATAAELETRIDYLNARVEAADRSTSGAAAVSLAVGQLALALKGSGAFSAELNAVKAFAGADAEMAEAVAALEPRAAAGVPTVSELRARFPAVADAVNRAEATLKGEGWLENAANRLSALVSVRRTGETAAAAGGADAAIAGAEGALAAGDLAAAVQAVETLEPPGAAAADGWLDDARARLAAERLIATLQAHAISLLAARG